ncbi:MAG: tetratricopeptide repeat protein [Bacteroidales bacterium]
MKTINVNNTIENYLSGITGKAEEAWLKEEIRKDPALAREVNLRRRTNEILADRNIIDLRTKLGAIEMKKRYSGTVRRTAIRAASYAAAVLLVLLISSALYFAFRPGSNETLFNKYYARYESPGNVRSVVSSGNSLMENAIASYSAKEYDKAIEYLQQVIGTGQADMETVFMHGVASMEVRNYPVASGSFTKVIENNDNLYLEDAAWYLGLCYMKTGDSEKALNQFKAIAASKSRYSKEAAKLARRLK